MILALKIITNNSILSHSIVNVRLCLSERHVQRQSHFGVVVVVVDVISFSDVNI